MVKYFVIMGVWFCRFLLAVIFIAGFGADAFAQIVGNRSSNSEIGSSVEFMCRGGNAFNCPSAVVNDLNNNCRARRNRHDTSVVMRIAQFRGQGAPDGARLYAVCDNGEWYFMGEGAAGRERAVLRAAELEGMDCENGFATAAIQSVVDSTTPDPRVDMWTRSGRLQAGGIRCDSCLLPNGEWDRASRECNCRGTDMEWVFDPASGTGVCNRLVTSCGAGFFLAGANDTECTACSAGYFCPGFSNISTAQRIAGLGRSVCPSPFGNSPAGSVAVGACYARCVGNQYWTGSKCADCQPGFNCPEENIFVANGTTGVQNSMPRTFQVQVVIDGQVFGEVLECTYGQPCTIAAPREDDIPDGFIIQGFTVQAG